MKKFLIALCTVLACASTASAQTKLGHIDRNQLMGMLPERPAAKEKIEKFAAELKARLDAMAAEYQTKLADVQARFEQMTQTEKESAQRELGEMEQRIGTAQENAKADLDKQEQELLAPMLERTDKAIKDAAAEGNFTYVFDTSLGAVLYYDKGEDIMPLVKKKLNIP